MTQGVWPAVLGRFDWTALPFVRAVQHPDVSEIIGAFAASLVILGAISLVALLTRYRLWRPMWSEWLTSLDHKKIGIMYIVIAFVMLSRALIEAVLMRMQQASRDRHASRLSSRPTISAQLFSTHGSHHDFLHGDALPDRHHQLCHAAADRQPATSPSRWAQLGQRCG